MASAYAARFRSRLDGGETLWLLGINAQAHDTGACLVEVTPGEGARVVVNYEEDRLRFERECRGFPAESIRAIAGDLEALGLSVNDLFAAVLPFDLPALLGVAGAGVFGESLGVDLLRSNNDLMQDTSVTLAEFLLPARLNRALGTTTRVPVLSVRHHDTHAWHSYAASPFVDDDGPTLVVVMDAIGDTASSSLYRACRESVSLLYENRSLWDSLGFYYAAMTSALGGWPMGRGEGRLMGAAAYGNRSREENPYYRDLRRIFSLDSADGELRLNRSLANWPRGGFHIPFSDELRAILGEPVSPDDHWEPEHSLDFDPEATRTPELQTRLDRIAACQLVFEDAVEFVVRSGLERCAASSVVITGGSSLNCQANQHLLERLPGVQIWVPPTPGDAGVQMGGAIAFALRNGARLSNPMPTPYMSGHAPSSRALQDCVHTRSDLRTRHLGLIESPASLREIAAFSAQLLCNGDLVALVQGPAELGLRALGNRSILADPRSVESRTKINLAVKHREAFRPLAPMMTLETAQRLFDLPAGTSARNYDALAYMAVTVRAKEGTAAICPAALHEDGTARIQIVDGSRNRLAFELLRGFGEKTGIEMLVNTSLNVRSPIATTIDQAIDTLLRSPELSVMVVVDDTGHVWAVEHPVQAANGVATSERADNNTE